MKFLAPANLADQIEVEHMTTTRERQFALTPEQQARLQRQRELIAAEQPQLQAKLERIHEARQDGVEPAGPKAALDSTAS